LEEGEELLRKENEKLKEEILRMKKEMARQHVVIQRMKEENDEGGNKLKEIRCD